MASFITIRLDTTPPAGVSISINGGAVFATAQAVTAAIATTDPDTTGYQMLIWGDVDNADNANIQTTEGASTWITYNASQAVKLSSGDGSKTLHVKVRDDVWNVSSEATDSITLDTTLPVVTVDSGPTPDKISKVATKDESDFTWESDSQYDEYKVKVVPSSGSIHTAGTQIPTTAGSTNVASTTPNQPAATPVTTTINGTDLETASAGDGDKIVKVFVKDDAGNWSV